MCVDQSTRRGGKLEYVLHTKTANRILYLGDGGNRTPDFLYAKQTFYHWTTSPGFAPLGFDPRTFGLWAQHASSAPRSTYFQSGNVKFKYCYVFIVLPEDLSMKVGSNADLIKSLATRHSGRWFLDGVEWKCQIVVWYGNMTILLRTYVTLPLTYHMIVSSFEAPT